MVSHNEHTKAVSLIWGLIQNVDGFDVGRLDIKQVAEGVQHVPGLVEATVQNMNEVWEVLQTGSAARAVSSTNANELSSRSHWFVYIHQALFSKY
jgi:hypothetical protein